MYQSAKHPGAQQSVLKMHLIYGHAARVIVWLGCPCRPWSFKPILDTLSQGESYSEDCFSWRCQVRTKPHKHARAIEGFAKLPWFFRGWVVQETWFAREVTAQYGKHTVSWYQFESMVGMLRVTALHSMSDFLTPEGRILLRLMRIVSSLRNVREQHQNEKSMDLGHMISFARTRMTSDPRDKVFAFINLLSSVPPSLQPDYNRSVPGLFREVS